MIMSYTMSKEEKQYLSSYDISKFERPSVASDIAIFSIRNDGACDNIRKLQKKSLKILLIKRASYPYKNCWALPGGFCKPGEDVIETAKRELFEETNVKNAYLQPVGVFGEKGRDPRGWIISNTFMALMDGETCTLRAGTDAWEARWFNIELTQEEKKREIKNDDFVLETAYELRLVNDETKLELKAKVEESKTFRHYHEEVCYQIIERDKVAFDHAEIILRALLSLRNNVSNNFKQAFDLLPELFTLTQLQNAVEIILNKKLLTANFRRKIADYVIETEQMTETAGYRPAKLFRRNVERFYSN